MNDKNVKARAEIPNREWVEFEISLNPRGLVTSAIWRGQGCHALLKSADALAAQLKNKELDTFRHEGSGHAHMLLKEVLEKLSGTSVSKEDEEICHCRKINRSTIDQMIVLGAQTPEKVKAWTTAGSGCGTCRPEVQKLIDERLIGRLGERSKKGA